LLLLSNLILASFQKKIAKQFDINPGEEMIRAIEEGESIGAKIHLVDRDIRTTLLRTWMSLGFWAKIKLLFQILLSLFETPELKEEEIEKMKQEDILENFLAEIGKSLPSLRKILIDERDAYIAEKIRTCPGKKIVAVVGAGHVPGIKSKWGLEQDLNELESLPSKGKFSLFFKWFFPVAVTVLIIWGFFSGGVKVGTNMVASWILVTGLSAGLGALIAFGHPLTILSSILAAPLTTLHPLIAAGWISGLVEAFLRRPKVRDFENLSTDILSIKGFWKNKITKILLVVVFTNLGASLGVFVAVPMMLKIL